MGIFLVIAACFFWGLVFAIPHYLVHYNPIEIALGRYFFFGLFSLGLLLLNGRHLLQKIYKEFWKKAALYSLVCTFFSYTALVACIKYSSSSTAALIFGMSPVTIPLYGNWYKKEYAYRHFFLSISLMGLGIILSNLNAFQIEGGSWGLYLFGLLCGVSGLAAWTWYTVNNFHVIQKTKELSSNDWVVMMGVVTFFLTLLFSAFYLLLSPDISRLLPAYVEFRQYIIGSVLLGVTSSWLAFYLWNLGNKRLPVSIAGQLTVFEMLFGLFLVYLIEARYPTFSEMSGIACMVIGVFAAFRILRKVAPATAAQH